MDRIGEEAFHIDGEKRVEEGLGFKTVELGRAFFHRGQRFVALVLVKTIESLAIGPLAPCIGCLDTRDEELMRGERKLIALFRRALHIRSGAVHAVTTAPGAGELAVDEGWNAAFATRRGQLIFWDDGISGGGEEGGFLRRQNEPGVWACSRLHGG